MNERNNDECTILNVILKARLQDLLWYFMSYTFATLFEKRSIKSLLSEYWNINRREMNLTFAGILQYIANLNYQVNTTSFLPKYGDSYGTNWTVKLLKKIIKAEE